MDLLVKDIVKIWNNGDASLVAGKEGILRKVEVFDMMEQQISNRGSENI